MNKVAMKNMIKNDGYLGFVFKDLSNRNPGLSEVEVLKVIYNSNIYDDSVYSSLYEKELQKIK